MIIYVKCIQIIYPGIQQSTFGCAVAALAAPPAAAPAAAPADALVDAPAAGLGEARRGEARRGGVGRGATPGAAHGAVAADANGTVPQNSIPLVTSTNLGCYIRSVAP